jgi:hypothetical protein
MTLSMTPSPYRMLTSLFPEQEDAERFCALTTQEAQLDMLGERFLHLQEDVSLTKTQRENYNALYGHILEKGCVVQEGPLAFPRIIGAMNACLSEFGLSEQDELDMHALLETLPNSTNCHMICSGVYCYLMLRREGNTSPTQEAFLARIHQSEAELKSGAADGYVLKVAGQYAGLTLALDCAYALAENPRKAQSYYQTVSGHEQEAGDEVLNTLETLLLDVGKYYLAYREVTDLPKRKDGLDSRPVFYLMRLFHQAHYRVGNKGELAEQALNTFDYKKQTQEHLNQLGLEKTEAYNELLRGLKWGGLCLGVSAAMLSVLFRDAFSKGDVPNPASKKAIHVPMPDTTRRDILKPGQIHWRDALKRTPELEKEQGGRRF